MPRLAIVMPAYNAERTLEATVRSLTGLEAELILCDDASGDQTAALSRRLGLRTLVHPINRGYGGNQKSLYDEALGLKAELIVMLHPDNQYDSSCLPAMLDMLGDGADMVLGNRMGTALRNRMPYWKYASNRALSHLQNRAFGCGLSEFHTGLRAYRAELLAAMPYRQFAEGFSFDSEVIAWALANGFRLGEVAAECRYGGEVSSIRFWPSVRYGLDTLRVVGRYRSGAYVRPGTR